MNSAWFMRLSGTTLCIVGYDFQESDFGSLAYHRIVESFKFAYGQRLLLGDPAFNTSVDGVSMYTE